MKYVCKTNFYSTINEKYTICKQDLWMLSKIF